jgi:hypothetical protein
VLVDTLLTGTLVFDEVLTGALVFDELLTGTLLDDEPPTPPPPPPPPITDPAAKVLLIAPILIFSKITYAFGDWLSTVAGTPDVIGQLPRAFPGPDGSLSVGYVESSHKQSA